MVIQIRKFLQLVGKLAFLGSALGGFGSTLNAAVISLDEAQRTLKAANYSMADRQLLLTQLEMVFDKLYVNRDLKIKDFGPSHDPLANLKLLREDMGSLSSEEFSSRVADVFTQLHDLHTSYEAPAPYRCGTVFMPVFFDSLVDQGVSKIYVGGHAAIGTSASESVPVGDQLLTVDGRPVESLLTELDAQSGGANPDAMRVRSLELLTMRPYGSSLRPQKPSIELKLKGSQGIYTAVLPWQVLVDEKCLSGAESLTDEPSLRGTLEPRRLAARAVATLSPERTKAALRRKMTLAVEPFQEKFNEIYGQRMLVENPLEDSQPLADIFEMQTIKTPAGKLGYIRLKTFNWEDLSLEVGVVTETFRRELERRFGDESPANAQTPVTGLVIDVRGNPGGIILFAERLVQLFAPQGVEPTTVQMLANELNREVFIYANGATNRWTDGIIKAMEAGSRYTTPEAITPKSEANKVGQVWFKPVVVLTDASCYSACDLFAAGMQDASAGKILGIHRSTGAGGANVMEYATFQAIMAESGSQPFVNLPYDQNFGISWRQTIRAGKNQGKLLENYGVESDIVVPLTLADLGKESRTLMARIHEQLDAMAPQWVSGVRAQKTGHRINLSNNTPVMWEETVWGIDELMVLQDTKLVSQVTLPLSSQPQRVSLKVPELSASWRDQPLVLVGKKEGQQVFRVVREVSWRGDYTVVSPQGFTLRFDDRRLDPLRIETLEGAEGWMIKGGVLRIGEGPHYGSRVLTRAFLPLSLGGRGATLTFDISLEAEEINDSLRIYLVDPLSGQRVDVYAGSSLPSQQGIQVTIPRTLGTSPLDKVEIVFEFESDENWNMEGPILDNIKVQGR